MKISLEVTGWLNIHGWNINKNRIKPNEIIANFHTKYRCVCEKGYQLDHTGKKCIDIDECEDPNVCTNGGICRNFPGSFQCICPKGSTFNETSKICEDENECEGERNVLLLYSQ